MVSKKVSYSHFCWLGCGEQTPLIRFPPYVILALCNSGFPVIWASYLHTTRVEGDPSGAQSLQSLGLLSNYAGAEHGWLCFCGPFVGAGWPGHARRYYKMETSIGRRKPDEIIS